MKHDASGNTSGGDGVPAVRRLIDQFRLSLPRLPEGPPPTLSTIAHPMDPLPPNAFTFDRSDLSRALEDDDVPFAVHHGEPAALHAARAIKLLDEHLAPFASTTIGPLSLTRKDLGSMLAGRLHDWSQLGRTAAPIRLLGHGGLVNRRVLRAFVERCFGHADLSHVNFLPSYEALAEAACSHRGAVAFGLRPAYVDFERLTAIDVDGLQPWPWRQTVGTLAMPIWLAWSEARPVPLEKIGAYLARVAANIGADTRCLTKYVADQRPAAKPPSRHGGESGFMPAVPLSRARTHTELPAT